MKRTATTLVVLAWASFSLGQATTPPSQSSSQPSASQSGAQQPGAAATPPQGKRPPQAKTKPEYDAYNAAVANSGDAAAMGKASDDFAAKFPDSELRILLFKITMHSFQNANNAEQMNAAAEKVLKIDPDDPEALVGTAEFIAEHTRDTDLDKDQRLAQAQKYAAHAVETVETALFIDNTRMALFPWSAM